MTLLRVTVHFVNPMETLLTVAYHKIDKRARILVFLVAHGYITEFKFWSQSDIDTPGSDIVHCITAYINQNSNVYGTLFSFQSGAPTGVVPRQWCSVYKAGNQLWIQLPARLVHTTCENNNGCCNQSIMIRYMYSRDWWK